jgi:hypothetical protein
VRLKAGENPERKLTFTDLQFADCGPATCKYMNFMLNLLIWMENCYARKLYD